MTPEEEQLVSELLVKRATFRRFTKQADPTGTPAPVPQPAAAPGTASFSDTLSQLGSRAATGVSNGLSQAGNWLQSLPPWAYPLLGVGAGAGAGALSSLSSKERRRRWLDNALYGGALGGGIAAIPMAYQYAKSLGGTPSQAMLSEAEQVINDLKASPTQGWRPWGTDPQAMDASAAAQERARALLSTNGYTPEQLSTMSHGELLRAAQRFPNAAAGPGWLEDPVQATADTFDSMPEIPQDAAIGAGIGTGVDLARAYRRHNLRLSQAPAALAGMSESQLRPVFEYTADPAAAVRQLKQDVAAGSGSNVVRARGGWLERLTGRGPEIQTPARAAYAPGSPTPTSPTPTPTQANPLGATQSQIAARVPFGELVGDPSVAVPQPSARQAAAPATRIPRAQRQALGRLAVAPPATAAKPPGLVRRTAGRHAGGLLGLLLGAGYGAYDIANDPTPVGMSPNGQPLAPRT